MNNDVFHHYALKVKPNYWIIFVKNSTQLHVKLKKKQRYAVLPIQLLPVSVTTEEY